MGTAPPETLTETQTVTTVALVTQTPSFTVEIEKNASTETSSEEYTQTSYSTLKTVPTSTITSGSTLTESISTEFAHETTTMDIKEKTSTPTGFSKKSTEKTELIFPITSTTEKFITVTSIGNVSESGEESPATGTTISTKAGTTYSITKASTQSSSGSTSEYPSTEPSSSISVYYETQTSVNRDEYSPPIEPDIFETTSSYTSKESSSSPSTFSPVFTDTQRTKTDIYEYTPPIEPDIPETTPTSATSGSPTSESYSVTEGLGDEKLSTSASVTTVQPAIQNGTERPFSYMTIPVSVIMDTGWTTTEKKRAKSPEATENPVITSTVNTSFEEKITEGSSSSDTAMTTGSTTLQERTTVEIKETSAGVEFTTIEGKFTSYTSPEISFTPTSDKYSITTSAAEGAISSVEGISTLVGEGSTEGVAGASTEIISTTESSVAFSTSSESRTTQKVSGEVTSSATSQSSVVSTETTHGIPISTESGTTLFTSREETGGMTIIGSSTVSGSHTVGIQTTEEASTTTKSSTSYQTIGEGETTVETEQSFDIISTGAQKDFKSTEPGSESLVSTTDSGIATNIPSEHTSTEISSERMSTFGSPTEERTISDGSTIYPETTESITYTSATGTTMENMERSEPTSGFSEVTQQAFPSTDTSGSGTTISIGPASEYTATGSFMTRTEETAMSEIPTETQPGTYASETTTHLFTSAMDMSETTSATTLAEEKTHATESILYTSPTKPVVTVTEKMPFTSATVTEEAVSTTESLFTYPSITTEKPESTIQMVEQRTDKTKTPKGITDIEQAKTTTEKTVATTTGTSQTTIFLETEEIMSSTGYIQDISTTTTGVPFNESIPIISIGNYSESIQNETTYCNEDSDCYTDEVCVKEKCIRGCSLGHCAPNALCTTRNHEITCECPPHFVGNSTTMCFQGIRFI